LHHAGERRDRLGLVDALAHEKRGDEIIGADTGL
jgi:hypothetical protein